MKRKILVISILILTIISGFVLWHKDSNNATLDEVSLKEGSLDKNMFAIMLETADSSDTYEESHDNKIPTQGYLYNQTKSGCMDSNNEKISDILTYNEETKKVSVRTNKTVYCYLYFKKDSTLPTVGDITLQGTPLDETVTLENGYTHTTEVKVSTSWTDDDVTSYCISTVANAINCEWPPISETKINEVSTTIEDEEGLQTVYVYLKDKSGNISESKNNTIIYDKNNPTVSNLEKTSDSETQIVLNVTTSDAGYEGSGIKSLSCSSESYSCTCTSDKCTLTGLSAGTSYNITVTATDNSGRTGTKSESFQTKKKPTASDILKDKVNQGGLKETNTGDLEYRYVGGQSDEVNNYVCFGANDCSNKKTHNHLYRIIGITVDGRIKIQKNSAIGADKWYTSGPDIKWPQSTIYTITLNNFYNNTNYVSQAMKFKIEIEHKWNIGDASSCSDGTTVYNAEYNNGESIHIGELGLSYASDYYFAYNERGTQNCFSGSYCKSWMIPSDYETLWGSQSFGNEWTMTRYGETNNHDYNVRAVGWDGCVGWGGMTNTHAVRPVFYLNSDVTISGGSGTLGSPYIIN